MGRRRKKLHQKIRKVVKKTRRRFPLRSFQYASFLSEEMPKRILQRQLKISSGRLNQMIRREGVPPTKRQARILTRLAQRVSSEKARRMGFTASEIRKGRSRPILMLTRARAMNAGIRRSRRIGWRKAASFLSASFEGLAAIRRKKLRSSLWEDFRKFISPGKFTRLEIRQATRRFTKNVL